MSFGGKIILFKGDHGKTSYQSCAYQQECGSAFSPPEFLQFTVGNIHLQSASTQGLLHTMCQN